LSHNYIVDQIFQAHLQGRPHGFTARTTVEPPPLGDLWTAQRTIDDWYESLSDAANESELELFASILSAAARPPTTDLPVFLRDARPELG
jgi:hypothetical protein